MIINFFAVKSESRRIDPFAVDDRRNFTKPDVYSSSLEANITSTGSGLSTPRTNSRKSSPVPIREARIMNNQSPKMSPINKAFIAPRTPIVPANDSGDYDEKKNPFAEEADDDDKNNPFNEDDDTISSREDDYNKNLNPFSS